ncbi:MAG TPA: SNF2-related protein [Candidatus Acidoferrum sp.]|nr:SNF2-related protein [Candidatus Acidoferrum sp.]
MSLDLDESLFSTAAGWDVMKHARACLAQGQVLSSAWAPPLLKGVVQTGETSVRASLVINGRASMENLCTCRESRQWGKICHHVVAVGLHWLKKQAEEKGGASARAAGAGLATSPPVKSISGLRREAGGEPAELFLILPPNLEPAITRGKVMLVFEAKWSGGRGPLNALPRGRAFTFSEADNAIIEQVETLTNGETPAILQMETRDFAALLPLLAEFPNLTLGKSQTVTVSRAPLKLPLRATLESNGEIILALKAQTAKPLQHGDWVWYQSQFQPLGLPEIAKDIFQAPVHVTRANVPQFLNQHWALLAADGIDANFKIEDFSLEPRAPRFLLALKGGLTQLSALLQFAYGSRIMTAGVTAADESLWLPDPDVTTRYGTRDFAAERTALSRLQRAGFSGPDVQGKLQLVGQNAVLNFLAREFPRLRQAWEVTLDEQLENRTLKNIERVEPKFQISSSGVQWFDLGVVFASGTGETFSAAEIQRLILSGQNHTRLRNGKMAVIDAQAVEELQEVLLDCAPQQHTAGYRINSTQAGFLEATLRRHSDWKVQAPAAWRERAAQQSGEAQLDCPPLGDLDTVLRPYQKHGVAWLHFLRANGFGGVLADEMGLGKTLQTLAFLNSLRLESGRPPEFRPHLIVCPTSLVFNWAAEAKKFTPQLAVLALHGPDRHSRFNDIAASDLVITSYALARRDAERYRGLEFDTVVLDEAQHIKNRQTQNAQAVKAIKARHRIVLTGTPLENSVLDLWSIFDFLMPGYLGTAKDFRERYELPIAKGKNAEAQSRLARRLKPFLLRRLKRDVAADLPARLEQVSFCELTPEQRGVYQQVIEASRKEVLAAVGEQGVAKSRMVVLTALLRLRQICCDLRLLKLENVNPADASGKLEMFGELLEEVIDGGHRLLVFSQFTAMLALLKEKLAAEEIEYCYLDGSTTNRAAEVERFQTNATIPVFLISLKAGGVGLNLTGADTVIHFDPWWNPAVEDQATDRAHRIGQTRIVTSYKLITRDTVEEKILTLQNRKREIIQATIGGEEEFAAALSWNEIQELLA